MIANRGAPFVHRTAVELIAHVTRIELTRHVWPPESFTGCSREGVLTEACERGRPTI